MERLKTIAKHFSPSKMISTRQSLCPPSLEELAEILQPALKANYRVAEVTVQQCPDLRKAPFYLASEGLSGDECIADIGGESNLYPMPQYDRKYSMIDIAKKMDMNPARGHLLGAGAGPFHRVGTNSELSPNFSWDGSFDSVNNSTYYTKVQATTSEARVVCERSPTTDCALMCNLYGSSGLPGNVLKITARGRNGNEKVFHECIRRALLEHYGDDKPVSIGGVFVIKRGRAHFHVMPDFPDKDQLPFKDTKQLVKWLTWHDFTAPVVCLSVFHTADTYKLGLRMEHTHCFSIDGDRGGHYHWDVSDDTQSEEIEYEAYFNTAKALYRIDRPVKAE